MVIQEKVITNFRFREMNCLLKKYRKHGQLELLFLQRLAERGHQESIRRAEGVGLCEGLQVRPRARCIHRAKSTLDIVHFQGEKR